MLLYLKGEVTERKTQVYSTFPKYQKLAGLSQAHGSTPWVAGITFPGVPAESYTGRGAARTECHWPKQWLNHNTHRPVCHFDCILSIP